VCLGKYKNTKEIITMHWSIFDICKTVGILKENKINMRWKVACHEGINAWYKEQRKVCAKKRLGKGCPLCAYSGALEERRYSSYSFLTHGTRRGWVVSRMTRLHLPPERSPVPIVQEVGWAAELIWKQRVEEKPSAIVRDPGCQVCSQSLYWQSSRRRGECLIDLYCKKLE
jgi:hypothetical protein